MSNLDRAKAYLNDALIQDYFKQTEEALYRALENASERDDTHLRSLCLMAKANRNFKSYLQSFLETEKIDEFQSKTSFPDRVKQFIRK